MDTDQWANGATARAGSAASSRGACLLLALAAGMLVALLAYTPAGDLLDRFELRTIDWRFTTRGPRPTSGQIVIVAVDDRSLRAVGPWRWPRARFATLVDRLTAAGARTIAFDIFMPEPDTGPGGPQSDAALTAAVRRSGRVFQAVATITGPAGHDPAAAAAEQALAPFAFDAARVLPGSGFDAGAHLPEVNAVAGPYAALCRAGRGVGFVDVVGSPDGVYRHSLPLVRHANRLYPGLALAVAADALGIPPAEITVRAGRSVSLGSRRSIPIDRAGHWMLDFAGPSGSFPYYSAGDVLTAPDSIPAGAFRDKLVLIAVTATGLYDLRASPFGAVFNGVETQANALDNLLTGRFLRPQRPEAAALYTILWALLIGLAVSRLGPRVYWPLSAGLLLAQALIAIWLFDTQGLAIAMVMPALGAVGALLASAAFQMIVQERRHDALQHTLGRFVPPEIATRLSAEGAAPSAAGELRTVTVLFADLRGFTSASASIGPRDTVSLLNRYFELMHEAIFDFGGTLDKFMGDELMAFFNAPVEQLDHAPLAVAAALEMQHRIETCRAEWAFWGMPDLEARIGISTGEAVVGYVGSGERMQYTAIGPDVNIASRLEELAEDQGCHIVISETTYALVREVADCRRLGSFALHNVVGEVVAYEVLGMHERGPAATPVE